MNLCECDNIFIEKKMEVDDVLSDGSLQMIRLSLHSLEFEGKFEFIFHIFL